MDAFAVSCAIPLCGVPLNLPAILRVAGSFGFFQGLMPLIGYALAGIARDLIAPVDHWIALFLLAFVGGKMIRDGLESAGGCPSMGGDPTRGRILFLLSLGTSIDALAVGVSLLGMRTAVVPTILVIALTTFGLCLLGISASGRLFRGQGGRLQVLGGMVLIGIGLKILLEHLGFLG
jgi:putative Mn2+ efflux pump MntP